MPFLNFSADALIFTDQSRIAGGIIGTDDAGSAAMLTSRLLRMFEEVYFSGSQAETVDFDKLVETPALAVSPTDRQSVAALLAEIADSTSELAVGTASQSLGPITTANFSDDGVINLNGQDRWRPAGQLISRQSEHFTIHLAVSTMDLTGKVQAPDLVGSTRLTPKGTQLRASDVGCGICGTCGACGACAICGEVNAGVAIIAASAVIAVTGLSGMSLEPRQQLDMMARKVRPSQELLEARDQLNKFLQPGP